MTTNVVKQAVSTLTADLDRKPAVSAFMKRDTPIQQTRSTCCYCGVGCGVIIEHDGQRIVNVAGDPDHPANFGQLCTKGSTLHLTAQAGGRLLYPELRLGRQAPRTRVSWERALGHAADVFADIIAEHGPDAVAFYISGQLLTEDYYIFNKLAKGLIGTNNIDTNSRLCMSSAVAGYKQSLGADAPPACYEDIDHTDCLLIAGANPAYAHPILFRRIEAARQRNPEMKMIVIDPRRTDTAAMADLHLPLLPGTDLVLLGSLLHVLLWEGFVDHAYVAAHTEGFAEARNSVRELTPAAAGAVCGVAPDDIVKAARWFGEARAALSMWCQGLNQSTHGTANTAAIVQLHLATGQLGRPGAGPFSLTGQPNAMGGREVGGMSNLLPGHRQLASAADRAEVAAFWGVDAIPAQPGHTAVELFDALKDGRVKAVWIACTNPAQSMPQLASVRAALENARFVVVQEAFAGTETTEYADLLLPATTWGEKEGTVTNSERRITHVRPAVPAPGAAREDWVIVRDFAQQLAPRLHRSSPQPCFDYPDVEAIFREHAATTVGRDLDIGALTYAVLDCVGPQQWPYRQGSGTQRLYTDGHFATPNGRARFTPLTVTITAEKTNATFPLQLTTGRLRDQWHGMSRTGKAARLFNHVSEAVLSMAPDDMRRRGLRDRDLVEMRGRRGRIVVRVQGSDEVYNGRAFMPMHFGARHLSHGGVNELMSGDFDPVSKQPELKHAAVEVRKIDLPFEAVLLRTVQDEANPSSAILSMFNAVQPRLAQFGYASAALQGHEQPVLIVRIAHAAPLTPALLQELDNVLDLPDGRCLTYADPARNISKRALIHSDRLLGVRLTGDLAAAEWLLETMLAQSSTTAIRPWLLASLSKPPAEAKMRGRIICNCHNVSASEIRAGIEQGMDLPDLQAGLKCGTSCGSCLPEIRRLFLK